MSVYLKKFGLDRLEVEVETCRVINRNQGNGGNQYKAWKRAFLGEVLLRVSGKFEINGEWVMNPLIKVLVDLKTYQPLDKIRQEQLTVVPVASGLEKPGVLKIDKKIYLLKNPGTIKGTVIDTIESDSGLRYIKRGLGGAAKVAMWRKLGLILTQKHNDVDNRFYHQDKDDQFPSCSKCINKCYVQPPEGPVSGDAHKPKYKCAMTGEELDCGAANIGNWLTERDHGLLHGLKGHMYLDGNKRLKGDGVYSDNDFFSVQTGGNHTSMSEIRDGDFEYHADDCPFYAPRIVLPERGKWTQSLDKVYLAGVVVNFR